jgi:hypothetical protein
MKISNAGAAFALAVVACAAAVPASAQLDMSGASEILAGIRAQKSATGPQAPAKNAAAKAVPPSADDAAWRKIVDLVKKKGKYAPQNFPTPGQFSLEDVGGDKNADHAEEHVTFFGIMNDDELFEAAGAGLMSDDWKKGPDGNWRVDRWLFQVDVYGTVQDVAHYLMVMTPDLQPAGIKEDPLKPADPRIGQKFAASVAHWAAVRP